jgi:hypothetical protein
MITHLALCASAAALLTGCPLLDVAVEISEVCLTYENVEVKGTSESALQSTFAFDDLERIHELLELDAELRFVRAEARVTSGLDSFAFVEAATLTIASGDPESTLPTLVVHECTGDCLASGTALELPATVQASAGDYLAGESIIVGVDFAGRAPAQDWTMDIDICVSGKLGYTLEP